MVSLLPAQVFLLEDKLRELFQGLEFSQYVNSPDFSTGIDIYVITNDRYHFGSSAVLYENLLRDFADEKGVDELILLPVSLHEMLAVPCTDSILPSFCRMMMEGFAYDPAAPANFLSSQTYIYSRKTNQIDYLLDDGK